jgi:hypothetical protein
MLERKILIMDTLYAGHAVENCWERCKVFAVFI